MEIKNLKVYLSAVVEWAYDNDKELYYNIDNIFSVYKCRCSLSDEESSFVRELVRSNGFDILDSLKKALNLADYHDTLKFKWTFIDDNNAPAGGEMWKYSHRKGHKYIDINLLIEERIKYLEKEGLDDWHKSRDHRKHEHFRWWINHILESEKLMSLRLFVENDTRCFDTLFLGSNRDEAFSVILKYILDRNICPSVHDNKLIVPDFMNPDGDNPRYLTTSGKFGGFNYLVYLTAEELQDIYNNKINKRILRSLDKPCWSYIKTFKGSLKDTKFFIYIQ